MSLPSLKWGNEHEKSDSTNYSIITQIANQLGTFRSLLRLLFTFNKSVLATTLKRENSKE